MGAASGFSVREGQGPRDPLRAVLALVTSFGPRLLFAARLAASVSLALFITYYLELQNSFWAATTAAIVCQPNLGASVQKGRSRALGTAIGAMTMVALLGMFAQQRNMLIFCFALFCGLCGFAGVMLRSIAAYAAVLAGITATIIFVDSLSNPTTAFFLAVIRVSEIGIGIAAATLVMLLTDFGMARRALAAQLESAAEHLAGGFLATLAGGCATERMGSARRDMIRALGPLNAAIDAATGESSYLFCLRGNLRAACDALLGALASWRDAGHHQMQAGEEPELRERLATLLTRIDVPRIGSDPRTVRSASQQIIAEIGALRTGSPAACMLADAARDVAIALDAIADALLVLRRERTERRPAKPRPLILDDPLPALLGGLRAFAAALTMSAFWIATAWPSGPFALVFAVVATLTFGSFGDQARALARDYTLGATAMAVLGGAIYFGVLPALSSFPALLTLLFLLFMPLGVMQAGTWHPVAFLAMSVVSLPLLGIGNPITYDASGYFNLCLAILSGSTVGTLFFVVMPIVGPQLRSRRLIALSLRDFRAVAQAAWPQDHLHHWTARLGRRLEVMPPQSTPREGGELLTLLSLGQAVLLLREGVCDEAGKHLLADALRDLAAGRVVPARDRLLALGHAVGERSPDDPPAEAGDHIHVRAQLAVILDALDDHADLLGASAHVPLLSFSS